MLLEREGELKAGGGRKSRMQVVDREEKERKLTLMVSILD